MRLENVLALTDATLVNDPFVKNFENIAVEAKNIKRGDLFIAFANEDIQEAILNGAYGIIFDKPTQISDHEIAWIQVKECEYALTKLLRFRFIDKSVVAYACNEIILELAQQISTDSNFIVLHQELRLAYKQLWNIEENTKILFSPSLHDKELFTNIHPLISIKRKSISVMEKTLFETSFIHNDIFYERQAISPFFIPYLEELFTIYNSLHVNFTIRKFSPIKHFKAIFTNKNLDIKEFGTSDKVLIFEPNIDLITSEIEFLHNNATWANIIYLLPHKIPKLEGRDIFIYESSDTIINILKNAHFNFALIVGVDKSILEQQSIQQRQLTLDFHN